MNLISRKPVERLTSTSEASNTAAECFFHATSECALGKILVARSVKGVCSILLGDDGIKLEADLAKRFPKATLVQNEAMVSDDLMKISRYADDPWKGLDLTLDMRGTPLQRRVWQMIRAIPVGQTRSYMQLARLINCVYPSISTRVVENACAANPLALAVPCHRVVRADGGLADYRRDLMRKRELLKREAAA